MSEWKENTGEVPEEVTEDTIVKVKYRNGLVTIWYPSPDLGVFNNEPDLWFIDGGDHDVIFYKVVEG